MPPLMGVSFMLPKLLAGEFIADDLLGELSANTSESWRPCDDRTAAYYLCLASSSALAAAAAASF